MRKLIISGLAATLLFTSACSQQGMSGSPQKQDVGALAGALGGAFAGSTLGKGKGQLAAVAAGTLLGAYVGSEIGASLDKADQAYANRTAQSTFETGRTGVSTAWRNPDSGNNGTITPTRTFEQNGSYCREFSQTISVGGKSQQGYGTACRQPDGTWQIVK